MLLYAPVARLERSLGVSVDHQCFAWCNQLVVAVAEALVASRRFSPSIRSGEFLEFSLFPEDSRSRATSHRETVEKLERPLERYSRSVSKTRRTSRRVVGSQGCPQPQHLDLHFVLWNSAVFSPIRTLDSSNDSRGPWLSRTRSIVFARHLFNHTQTVTEFLLAPVVGRSRSARSGPTPTRPSSSRSRKPAKVSLFEFSGNN